MAKVIHHAGHDYWQTWFYDECEQFSLFGVTQKHLKYMIVLYDQGTQLFLEDTPVFRASGRAFHRICGPYSLVDASPIPNQCVPIHVVQGRVIVYLDQHPERGPWGNGTRRRTNVCGLDLKYRQMASQYDYYPYRFRICRTAQWRERRLEHTSDCWMCGLTA